MSSNDSAARAVEWLEVQLRELAGIRNATARDPSFKNWRQATLTVMQRIWPGDQACSERFRRIPFSPADPRADARAVREWYSRGCQEAARVLAGFIKDIRADGLLETPGSDVREPEASEFEDGFPTVDLPAGDLGGSTTASDMTDNLLADLVDAPPQGSDPSSPLPPQLRATVSTDEPEFTPPVLPVADARPAKKGLNMKARLRDLLGFAQLSAKALAGFPRETPETAAGTPPAPAPRSDLGVVPIGDFVPPAPALPPPVVSEPASPRTEWPLLRRSGNPASGAMPVPPAAPPANQSPAAPAESSSDSQATARSGSSVSMSKPTTLRGLIEKVSIESLISPAFRSSGDETPPPAAPPAAPTEEVQKPAWPTVGTRPATPPVAGSESEAIPPPPGASPPGGAPPPAARPDRKSVV